jgi:hypothetical protein
VNIRFNHLFIPHIINEGRRKFLILSFDLFHEDVIVAKIGSILATFACPNIAHQQTPTIAPTIGAAHLRFRC